MTGERKRVPLKIDGQVIGEAEIAETEEGIMFEAALSSGWVRGAIPRLTGQPCSFAIQEPDPDLTVVPHDPLAPLPLRVRQKDASGDEG